MCGFSDSPAGLVRRISNSKAVWVGIPSNGSPGWMDDFDKDTCCSMNSVISKRLRDQEVTAYERGEEASIGRPVHVAAPSPVPAGNRQTYAAAISLVARIGSFNALQRAVKLASRGRALPVSHR